MDLSNIFTEADKEATPFSTSAPWIRESDETTLIPPADLAGHPARSTLGVYDRCYHTSILDKHRIPGPAWWRRYLAHMLILKRMACGPLFSSTTMLTPNGDYVHTDHTFTVASASGNQLTLEAPSGTWYWRRFVVANLIHENSLYTPGGPYAQYFLKPIYGTLQAGDDLIPASNSVISGKALPMVVKIGPGAVDDEGEDFVVTFDQDVANITEKADPSGASADTVTIRVHATLPEYWPCLRDSNPLPCVSKAVSFTVAQVAALTDAKTTLKDEDDDDTRIAFPYVGASGFASSFTVSRLDGGTATDITAAFLAAGRVDCEHDGSGGYVTTVWLGDKIGTSTGNGALITGDQKLSIKYNVPPSASTSSARRRTTWCQDRCQYSIQDPHGNYFCAKAERFTIVEADEETVRDAPEGLGDYVEECYQWTSDGSSGRGCPDFERAEPFGPQDIEDLWDQIWSDHGLEMIQSAWGSTTYYLDRWGITGLMHLLRGRMTKETEDGTPQVIPAQLSRVGYLDTTSDDLDFVQGAVMEEGTGNDLDDDTTWGRDGLLAHKSISPARPPVFASAWTDTLDPYRAWRDYPQILQAAARSSSTAGRSIAQTSEVREDWKDVITGIVLREDDQEVVGDRWTWKSNSDGTLEMWPNARPLSTYTATIVSGTVAAASTDGAYKKIEISNTWQTVHYVDTGPPVTYPTGTVRAGAGFAGAHTRFQLVKDTYFGDGGNVRRGCCEGDCVIFSGTGLSSDITSEGFYVQRAIPFAGTFEAMGWNGDTGDTAPSGIVVPTNFYGSSGWGGQRDCVWIYDPDGKITSPSALVGATITAKVDGVFAPTATPVIKTEVRNSNNWTTRTPAMNRLLGSITFTAAMTAAMLAAAGGDETTEHNVLVTADVMDRRQVLPAESGVNLLVDALEALDTFHVPIGGTGTNFHMVVGHELAPCTEEWGAWSGGAQYSGTWEAGESYQAYLDATGLTNALELHVGWHEYVYFMPQTQVSFKAKHYPFSPGGVLETIPDGATISAAYVRMKLSDVEETIDTYTKTAGNTVAKTDTDYSNTSVSSIGIAILAYEPGSSDPIAVWTSAGVAADEDEWVLVDVTSFASAWLSSLRRNTNIGYCLALVSPDVGATPTLDDLSAMLPELDFSAYEPQFENCVPGSWGETSRDNNPDYNDRAYTLEDRFVTVGSVDFGGMYVTIDSLPTTIGGESMATLSPPSNPEHYNRVVQPIPPEE